MEFQIQASSLYTALRYLAHVLPSQPLLPVLNHFYFEYEDGELKIASYDLKAHTEINVKITSKSKGLRKWIVPGKMLMETLKEIKPNELINFKVSQEDNSVQLKTDNGFYKIACGDVNQYPDLPECPQITSSINKRIIEQGINSTLPFTSSDQFRPAMMCIHFKSLKDGKIAVASTNGHQLVEHQFKSEYKFKHPINIEARYAKIMAALMAGTVEKEIYISIIPNRLYTVIGEYTFSVKIVEEQFPKYENVLPTKGFLTNVTIDRGALLSVVTRSGFYTDNYGRIIKIQFADQRVEVTSKDDDYLNSSYQSMECKKEGNDIEIGFNAAFLANQLKALTCQKINIQLQTAQSGALILPADDEGEPDLIKAYIMPSLILEKVNA